MRGLGAYGLPTGILVIGILLIVGSLGGPGLATPNGDPLAPIPDSLEAMLETALRSNPEILVQEAQLREAQAALNQTRLAVTQSVVRLHFSRQEQRKVIVQHQAELKRVTALYQAGAASDTETRRIEIAIAQAEGELAGIGADLRYALGSGGAVDYAALFPRNPLERDTQSPPEAAPAEISEAMVMVLDGKSLQASFDDLPIPELLEFLGTITGVSFLLSPQIDSEETVTLNLRGPVTLRQTLHAIADLTEIHFAVREYGFLAVYPGEQPEGAALIPPEPN